MNEDSLVQTGIIRERTVFGPSWDELELRHLEAFLADAPSEPLEWEGKSEWSPDAIRAAVCGFANSHNGGYLILGADKPKGSPWRLRGLEFPNGDPPSDVSDVISNGGVTPYPDELDVRDFKLGGRQVAVVRVGPIATSPCMTKGTAYERVAGKTIPVTDPSRLASLFQRGDAAREAGRTKAEGMAQQMFGHATDSSKVWFSLGLAAPGYLLDLTTRLFTSRFNDEALDLLSGMLIEEPHPSLRPQTLLTTNQLELIYNAQAVDKRLGYNWSVRVSRTGVVGVHWSACVDEGNVRYIVPGLGSPLGKAWRFGHNALRKLGLLAPRYLHVYIVVPPRLEHLSQVALGEVFEPTEGALAGFERELRRASGEEIFEPQSQATNTPDAQS